MTITHSIATDASNILIGTAKRAALPSAVVLAVLFLANVYDPTGAFRIKYVAFCLAALFSIWKLEHWNLSTREIAAGLLLFLVWPVWSLLYGAARRGDVRIGINEVTPFLFTLPLVTVLPCVDEKRGLRLFYACMLSLAAVVVVSFGLFVLFPDSGLSARLFDLLTGLHEREGYFGAKSFGDTQIPGIYFGSTLFLVPTSVYYLFAGKLVRAVAAFLALAFAFSKAGIAIVIVFGLIYSVRTLLGPRFPQPGVRAPARSSFYLRATLPLLLLAGLTSSVLLALPSFSEEMADTLASQSGSAQVRIGHFDSVVKLFTDNPHYLFVGQGVGLPFYTSGESEFVQNIEIDHLNAIRKFGLPWFIGFTVIVFCSSWRLIKSKGQEECAAGFALMSMYFAAGTNPVLLSPLFIMLMTLSYFAERSTYGRTS